MLASLLSCATRVFSVDSTFCAHSLVARPHLSIRVCVSVCHILLLVYLLHLRICESLSTLLTHANIFASNFCATILTELHHKPYLCRCEKPTRIGTNCAISLIHCQHQSRYIGISSSLSPTHICSSLVMDRQGISSPVFHGNDGANNYITKASIFDLQRQMQGAQSRLQERIENLSINIHHSEARKRYYIDNKLSAQKEEQDARMEEIRTSLAKRSSPSSSLR